MLWRVSQIPGLLGPENGEERLAINPPGGRKAVEASTIYGHSANSPLPIYVRFSPRRKPHGTFSEGVAKQKGLDRSGCGAATQAGSAEECGHSLNLAQFRAKVTLPARLHVVGEGDHRPPGVPSQGTRPERGGVPWIPAGRTPAGLRRFDVFALLTVDEPFGMVIPRPLPRACCSWPGSRRTLETRRGTQGCADAFDHQPLRGAGRDMTLRSRGDALPCRGPHIRMRSVVSHAPSLLKA